MLSGIHDIYCEQKCEYTITFQYFDSADDPINLMVSYDNVRFVARRSSLTQTKDLFEISQDGTATEGHVPFPTSEIYGNVTVSTNQITINIHTDTMTSIYPGSYFYYVFLETSSGNNDCLIKGKFVVEAP
jgi:hypothetical protein